MSAKSCPAPCELMLPRMPWAHFTVFPIVAPLCCAVTAETWPCTNPVLTPFAFTNLLSFQEGGRARSLFTDHELVPHFFFVLLCISSRFPPCLGVVVAVLCVVLSLGLPSPPTPSSFFVPHCLCTPLLSAPHMLTSKTPRFVFFSCCKTFASSALEVSPFLSSQPSSSWRPQLNLSPFSTLFPP